MSPSLLAGRERNNGEQFGQVAASFAALPRRYCTRCAPKPSVVPVAFALSSVDCAASISVVVGADGFAGHRNGMPRCPADPEGLYVITLRDVSQFCPLTICPASHSGLPR